MPKLALTDRYIRAIQPAPAGKREDHWDTVVPSFAVRVTDTGQRSYFVLRRPKGSDKLRRVTIGECKVRDDGPGLTLAAARDKARDIVVLMDKGIDPVAAKEAEAETAKVAAEASAKNTLRVRYEAWEAAGYPTLKARDGDLRPRSVVELKRYFKRLTDKLGDLDMRSINRMQMTEVIDGFIDPTKRKGGKVTADRARTHYNGFFRWALDAGYVDSNPVPVRRHVVYRPRARVLSDAELALVWAAAPVAGEVYGGLVRCLMATLQRRNEVAGMAWPEVGDDGVWRIPAERMKGKRGHSLPLPPLVLNIMQAMPRIELEGGKLSDPVFPGRVADGGAGVKLPSNHGARKRLIDARIAELNGGKAIEAWTLHDLRRSGMTWLEGQGVSDAIRSEIAGHSKMSRQGVTAVYSLAEMHKQKLAALGQWCDHLVEVTKAPTPAAGDADKVVPIGKGRKRAA